MRPNLSCQSVFIFALLQEWYLLWSLVTAIKRFLPSSPHTWAIKNYLIDQVSLKDSEHSLFRIWFQKQALQGPFIIPVSELRTWGRKREGGRWKKNYFENLPNGEFVSPPAFPQRVGLKLNTSKLFWYVFSSSIYSPTTEKWRKDPYFVVGPWN